MFGQTGPKTPETGKNPKPRAQTMPTFSNTLPSVSKHQGFDLHRTPTTGYINGTCTCEQFLVCDTHFWHGRTTPCERETNDEGKTIDDSLCPACRDKQSYRTHVYISAVDLKNMTHFLFECTANAAKPFEDYYQTCGSLRGMAFHAARPKGTPNGKVVITTTTANLGRVKLPNAPDLVRALAVIWRLPKLALPVEEQPHHAPIVRCNHAALESMREQPDNAADPQLIGDILRSGNGRQRKAQLA
jgi:hypothetical protein